MSRERYLKFRMFSPDFEPSGCYSVEFVRGVYLKIIEDGNGTCYVSMWDGFKWRQYKYYSGYNGRKRAITHANKLVRNILDKLCKYMPLEHAKYFLFKEISKEDGFGGITELDGIKCRSLTKDIDLFIKLYNEAKELGKVESFLRNRKKTIKEWRMSPNYGGYRK